MAEVWWEMPVIELVATKACDHAWWEMAEVWWEMAEASSATTMY